MFNLKRDWKIVFQSEFVFQSVNQPRLPTITGWDFQLICTLTRFWHYQYSYFSHSTRYIEVSHQCFNLHFPRTRLRDFTFTFHFDALEKEMATHSSVLAWRIPGTGEPGGLQSMGSRRVRHNWATSLSLFTFMHWRRKWQPTPVFLPGESQGRGSMMGCRLWGGTELDTTEAI